MAAASEADVLFYGGGAGGGKTFYLLMEAIRHMHVKGFGGTIFRREFSQITVEGGLWDEAEKIFPYFHGKPNVVDRFFRWPNNNALSFSGLEHEKDVYKNQGAQICYEGFDELTHFTRKQFFYMLSRNRSTCGIKPYVRATMNPDKRSWVRPIVDWYLYPKEHPLHGKPNPERAGKIRYFIVLEDKMIWANTTEELLEKYGKDQMPLSFTFVPAKLTDNRVLMEKDPAYRAKLMALSAVERKRLLDQDWDAEEVAGEMFKRSWFPIVDSIPGRVTHSFRVWDRAATKPSEGNPSPDWSRGVRMDLLENGKVLVRHMESIQDSASAVEQAILNVATQDGKKVSIGLFQDPGSAGKGEVEYMVKRLMGYDVRVLAQTQDKVTRAKPMSAQAEFGNILLLAGPWNDDFLSEMDSFPSKGHHDDIVDASSGAFSLTVSGASGTFTSEMADNESTNELQQW